MNQTLKHSILVKMQIREYFQGYANYGDVVDELRDDRIDSNQEAIKSHTGYDASMDGSLHVFYYSDGSALVVDSATGTTAI